MVPRPAGSPRQLLGVLAWVAVAVFGQGCAGSGGLPAGPPPADALERAVLRTLDQGSARVLARVKSAGAAAVVVEGVTSLVGPEAALEAKVEGRPDSMSSEVRVTAGGAWIRPPGTTEWIAVGAAQTGASPAGSVRTVLQDLVGAGDVTGRGRRLTAMVDGTPVSVVLDDHGRVGGVHRQRDGIEVTLELSDFGVEVAVAPP